MARVFIVHCWGGKPQQKWYPWLASSLKARGHQVFVPAMPETDTPKIGPWLKKMKATVGAVRPSDVFVGHSIGCQTIMRFLLSQPKKCAAALLVAGFAMPMNFSAEEAATVLEWLYPTFDPALVKSKSRAWRAIFSSNDPWVDGNINGQIFEKTLGAKVNIYPNRGHFSDEKKDRELPEALTILKSLGL